MKFMLYICGFVVLTSILVSDAQSFIPIRDVQWGACPVSEYYEKLASKKQKNIFPQSSSFPFGAGVPQTTAEQWLEHANALEGNLDCGNFTVPIDWESDGSHMMDTIQFFVWRVRSPHGMTARNQLWVLNGGPGGDGGSLVPLADTLFETLGCDWDFIFPDHRGTGYSTYLGCPDLQNATSCEAYLDEVWGDNLHYFTTTNAAYDINHGIENLAPNYKHTYLYGVSYGTYWANRYLVINPSRQDAVVLDGVCPSDLCRLYQYDINTDYAGKALVEYCGLDTTCIANLGLSPIHSFEQVFDLLKTGQLACAKRVAITPEYLRYLLTQALGDDTARVLIGPIIKRLLRCNDDDVAALTYALFTSSEDKSEMEDTDSDPGSSDVLGSNIILSEMFIPTNMALPSFKELEAVYNKTYFAYGSPLSMRQTYDTWNRYTPDSHLNAYPAYKGPVLMMNGNLDQATALSWATKASNHFTASKQQLVMIPYSSHASVWHSSVDNSNITCALQLMKSFLTSEHHDVDTSCIDHVIAPDFSGTSDRSQEASMKYLNTANMWGQDE